MMKKKALLNLLTIILFAVVISMPLLFFHHEEGRVSILENKTAAARPAVAKDNIFDRQLTADLDEYFSDNIGLKEESILLHISAMYRLFDKLCIPNQIEGKENHTFYITDPILQIYQGLDCITDEQMSEITDAFLDLNETAVANGYQFIFMPIPNKEEIYGEYMPDDIHVISEESMLHSVKNALIQSTDISIVDTETALLQHKEDGRLLYYRNRDASHWNHYGAYIGYCELIKETQKSSPEITMPQNFLIGEAEDYFPFQLASYKSLSWTFSDMTDFSYTIVPSDGWKGVKDNSTPSGFSLAGDVQDNYFHYHNDSVSGKKLFVLGDSYIYTFMLPMLSESFSDVYFLHSATSGETISELLQLVSPDFIVFESVSRMVNYSRLLFLIKHVQDAIAEAALPDFEELSQTASSCILRFDNAEIGTNNTLHLSNYAGSNSVFISGWVVDDELTIPTGEVYFKIGELFIPAAKIDRPDLLSISPFEAGFQGNIPLELLEGLSQIEIYILTPDRTAFYSPAILQIEES